MADLGDRRHVERMVQLTVASTVEPVALRRSARRLDRRGAVVGREPLRCREAAGVADVAEDEPGDDRADAVDLDDRRA